MLTRRSTALAALLLLVAGCPSDDDDDGGAEPIFPEDYAATYQEVRDCRNSNEHDFHKVRILADPAAAPAYLGRAAPFPQGAIVLKEEFESGDVDCTGEIIQWTAMMKLADGSAPDSLDWSWQRVDPARTVREENTPRCIGCHMSCTCESEEDPDPACLATEGYLYTCAHEDGGG